MFFGCYGQYCQFCQFCQSLGSITIDIPKLKVSEVLHQSRKERGSPQDPPTLHVLTLIRQSPNDICLIVLCNLIHADPASRSKPHETQLNVIKLH